MKPQGGGDSPADDEELVIQTGCSDVSSTFHFAGTFYFNVSLIAVVTTANRKHKLVYWIADKF